MDPTIQSGWGGQPGILTTGGTITGSVWVISTHKYKVYVPKEVTVTQEDHERRIGNLEIKTSRLFEKFDKIMEEFQVVHRIETTTDHLNCAAAQQSKILNDFIAAITLRQNRIEKLEQIIIDRNLTG